MPIILVLFDIEYWLMAHFEGIHKFLGHPLGAYSNAVRTQTVPQQWTSLINRGH